jgi:hypothetical protein
VIESVAESMLNVCAVTVAFEGATESIPKPNAAIAVKAIRLKNVFCDITFLSVVVKKTFFSTAGKEKSFFSTAGKEKSLPRDAMHVLLHHIPHRVSGHGEET